MYVFIPHPSFVNSADFTKQFPRYQDYKDELNELYVHNLVGKTDGE